MPRIDSARQRALTRVKNVGILKKFWWPRLTDAQLSVNKTLNPISVILPPPEGLTRVDARCEYAALCTVACLSSYMRVFLHKPGSQKQYSRQYSNDVSNINCQADVRLHTVLSSFVTVSDSACYQQTTTWHAVSRHALRVFAVTVTVYNDGLQRQFIDNDQVQLGTNHHHPHRSKIKPGFHY
jgi:hypothetical protein